MLTTTRRLDRMFPSPTAFFGPDFGKWLDSVVFSEGMLPWSPASPATFPAMNVWEDENAVYVEAELPGFELSELDISLTGSELTIRGKRESSLEIPESATVHRRERSTGSFVRSVKLGLPIAGDKVNATMDAGVLTVTLPKAEESRPRKIEVRAR